MWSCLQFLLRGIRVRQLSASSPPDREKRQDPEPVRDAGHIDADPALPPQRQPESDDARLSLGDLNDEIVGWVISFLPGSTASAAEAALPSAWRAPFTRHSWWRSRCGLEYFSGHALPPEPSGIVGSWREKYRELAAAQGATAGTWCYRSRAHGLGDRFGAPQLFVGPRGHKLFSYGGWFRMLGPQTDLRWMRIATVCKLATEGATPGARSSLSNVAATASAAEGQGAVAGHSPQAEAAASSSSSAGQAAQAPARPAGAGQAGPDHSFRFQPSQTYGRPASRGGLQTLTTCWFQGGPPGRVRGNAPSPRFVQATAKEFGDPDAGVGASLVIAFGGSHDVLNRSESGTWAVGVLHEGEGSTPAKIIWGRPKPKYTAGEKATAQPTTPTRRAAHTATYVPPSLAGGTGQFPEGCVVVYGGHTDDCLRSLGSVDILDLATWCWHPKFAIGGSRVPQEHLRRHGHSATLVEVNGRGYILAVGGGRGNIAGGVRNYSHEEKSDVLVLDTHAWSWVGLVSLGRPVGAPPPGRHHTACAGLNGQVFLFGGGEHPGNRILVLQGHLCVRRAWGTNRQLELREVLVLSNKVPLGRRLHGTTCLLPWAPFLVVYGGSEGDIRLQDLWVCALGSVPADLKAYMGTNECWRTEDDWRSEGTDLMSREEFDDDVFDEESDSGSDDMEDWSDIESDPIPVRFMSRDGQIRIVRMVPAEVAQIGRGSIPQLSASVQATRSNDVTLMNALALAHPTLTTFRR